jgi:cytochrome c-type biogenesis protein CcmH/NrfG
VAAFAAAIALSTQSAAFDPSDAGTSAVFYVSIPLDSGLARKDREPAFGLQLQGKREYQAIRIDSNMLNFLPAGGLETKWILAGVVAAGAALALSGASKSTVQALQAQQTQHQAQQQQQQQQEQRQQPQQQPCPPTPVCK